jgi:hypothetical protein
MSVHNGGRWLRAAMDSVLGQSWRDLEFLIIDDASTDDSAAQIAAVSDERIRLIRLPENIGLTRSLNHGLQQASGEFVARQDADDVSTSERLARQLAFLQAHPEVPLVGAQARLMDAQGRSRGVRDLPLEPVSIRWLSLLDNPVIHTAVIFRTATIRDEFGGYDESFPCVQDYDLWARVLEKYPVFNLPERLVSVREHGSSVSAMRQSEARAMVRRVVRRLADAWLPQLALDDASIALLCAYRRHLGPDEVSPFHDLLGRVEAEFASRFPEAAANPEVGRTRAGVFARIGYNLLARDRALGMRELARAIGAWPAIAARLPWLRLAALFILGARTREVFRMARG